MIFSEARRKVRIFEGRDEVINVYWPLLLFPFIGFNLIFHTAWNSYETQAAFFVSGFIFLNVTHVIFTYIACAELPPLRRFITEKAQENPWSLVTWIGLAAFFLIYALMAHLTEVSPTVKDHFGQVFTFTRMFRALIIYGAFHVRKQTLGFFLLYNQKLLAVFDLSDEEKKKVQRLERIERWLFFPIVWQPVFFAIFVLMGWIEWRERTHWIQWISILPAFILVGLSRAYPRAKESNKFMFSWRILFVAFAPFEFISAIGERAHHGVEYYYIIKEFYVASRQKLSRVFYGTSLAYAAIACCTPQAAAFFYSLYSSPGEMGLFMLSLSIFVSATHMFHFYFDSVLFRFRDPLARKNILPLLMGAPPNHQDRIALIS